MKWKRKQAGRYKSECGRWEICHIKYAGRGCKTGWRLENLTRKPGSVGQPYFYWCDTLRDAKDMANALTNPYLVKGVI